MVLLESGEATSIIEGDDGLPKAINSRGEEVASEIYHGSGYLRESGKPKVLRSIKATNFCKGQNPWKAFDLYLFLDTSSIDIESEKLFSTSSSIGTWDNLESRRHMIIYHQDILIGTCDCETNPERIGWEDIINRLSASQFLDAKTSALLVTDSEMGLHNDINSRDEPIYNGQLLPKNITIAYASDGGTESWINKELKRRHNCAKKALLEVKSSLLYTRKALDEGRFYLKNKYDAH